MNEKELREKIREILEDWDGNDGVQHDLEDDLKNDFISEIAKGNLSCEEIVKFARIIAETNFDFAHWTA